MKQFKELLKRIDWKNPKTYLYAIGSVAVFSSVLGGLIQTDVLSVFGLFNLELPEGLRVAAAWLIALSGVALKLYGLVHNFFKDEDGNGIPDGIDKHMPDLSVEDDED